MRDQLLDAAPAVDTVVRGIRETGGEARREIVRDVVCVIDHLYQSRDVADDALHGYFTNNDTRLLLGRPPDWINGGLADDEEWRIEWVKSYFGLDLAASFAATGDPRYLDCWGQLVLSFCRQVPVGHDPSEVSARRVQNWLYAWQRLRRAPTFAGLPIGLEAALVERLAADVEHLLAHLTPERNHRTLELYALFVTALALPSLGSRLGIVELLDEVVVLLVDNALTDLLPDGVQRECSTDYHNIVLRSFVGVLANARRFGVALPDVLVERVERACEFGAALQRPDGSTPSFSDGDTGDFRATLQLAGQLLGRSDFVWVATSAREGTPPALLDSTFADGGYCTQRSGWGTARPFESESHLVLDCGPLGSGGHGHYDQLSVEIVGRGRSLIVDPGRFTYASLPRDEEGREAPDGADDWRHWFKGAAAHSGVTVDGLDPTPYRRGKPKGDQSIARLARRVSSPQLDVIVAELRSPRYDVVHTRRIAFVAREYWLVHDRLRTPANESHDYCLRWHLAAEQSGRVLVFGQEPVTLDGRSAPDGCTRPVSVAWADGFDLALACSAAAETTVESRWVSPSYGRKLAAPVVALTSTASDVDFVTVVHPGALDRVEIGFVGGGIRLSVSRVERDTPVVDRFAWDSEIEWERASDASTFGVRP